MMQKDNPEKGHKPIPVTIIGGFLGAGKTSLLNHILSGTHGVRAAVLVNDFGAINIDAKLVVGVEGETISLANGCICCTIRDDLVGACLGLLKRPEKPEHLFIELSGVSDPVPVINTFMETELGALFSLSSTLAIVDAEQFLHLQEELRPLVHVQIAAADMLVLNKIDLVAPDLLPGIKKRVQQMGPGSRILAVKQGKIPLELIFQTGLQPLASGEWKLGQKNDDPIKAHAFSTWHWTSASPLSLPKLRSVLGTLPEGIYRAKGILCLEELPCNRYVLQMVGRRYTIEEMDKWGTAESQSEIVLIGALNGFDTTQLKRDFDACIGTGDDSQSPVLRLSKKLFNL